MWARAKKFHRAKTPLIREAHEAKNHTKVV